MRTIAEYATEMAVWLLEQAQDEDDATYEERDYNPLLGSLWDVVVSDLDWAVYYRYSAYDALEQHAVALRHILEERPIRQAAVQAYCEDYIPGWERHTRQALAALEPGWRKQLGLRDVEPEAESA